MKNCSKIIFLFISASIVSCCLSSDCGYSPVTISVGFITPKNDYHYFNESDSIELRVFYGDSSFIQVDKQTVGEGDSVLLTFFAYPVISETEYFIMSNDTLLGELNIVFGEFEDKCCGSSLGIESLLLESDQNHSTEFGLNIIL